MSGYVYSEQREAVTTGVAQSALLGLLTDATKLLSKSGAATADALMRLLRTPVVDNWTQLAYIDRLTELGYLAEVPQAQAAPVFQQDRIFIPGPLMRT